jgi:hypothetical protein
LGAAVFAGFGAFVGNLRDHDSAVMTQACVASGFFCQPAGTTT